MRFAIVNAPHGTLREGEKVAIKRDSEDGLKYWVIGLDGYDHLISKTDVILL